MRKVIISSQVTNKLSDLKDYLKNDLKFSQEASYAYNNRMLVFIDSLAKPADYALCRFKRWRTLGYRCAVFEKNWVFAYEIVPQGIIIRDMSHTAVLTE